MVFRTCRIAAALSSFVASVILASCGGGSSAITANQMSSGIPPTTSTPATASQLIYTANRHANSIIVFPTDANGNVPPINTIAGPNTQLDVPVAVAVDSQGDIYGSGEGGIRVFAPGATGDATPIRVMGNVVYTGIAIDREDNVYGPPRAEEIDFFPAGSTMPTRIIEGPNTGLSRPFGIAVDNIGRTYVANQPGPCGPSGSITIYAAGASGNVAPTEFVGGTKTQISDPDAVALDQNGNIYVANFSGVVTIYAAGAQGNVPPIATITLPGNLGVLGIALDAEGNIYALGAEPVFAIYVYPPLTELPPGGTAMPIRTIAGNKTQLDDADGLAIH